MVGQQFLELLIEVRALVPQQHTFIACEAFLHFVLLGVQKVTCVTFVRARMRGRESASNAVRQICDRALVPQPIFKRLWQGHEFANSKSRLT